MDGKFVEFQSKMLAAFLKAFKVDPTPAGVITAVGGDPDKVFELVAFVQANGERLTNSFEAAVVGTAARVERMELHQAEQHLILIAIAQKLGITSRVEANKLVVESLAPPVDEAAE